MAMSGIGERDSVESSDRMRRGCRDGGSERRLLSSHQNADPQGLDNTP